MIMASFDDEFTSENQDNVKEDGTGRRDDWGDGSGGQRLPYMHKDMSSIPRTHT